MLHSALSTGPGMAGLLPNRLGSKLVTLFTPHTNPPIRLSHGVPLPMLFLQLECLPQALSQPFSFPRRAPVSASPSSLSLRGRNSLSPESTAFTMQTGTVCGDLLICPTVNCEHLSRADKRTDFSLAQDWLIGILLYGMDRKLWTEMLRLNSLWF